MKLQTFLAERALQAAHDLETALMNLPEEKRLWSAGGDARSALDMVAEVAMLNGTTADTLQNRGFGNFDWAAYTREKAELAQDWPALKTLIDRNTACVADVIRSVPDDALAIEVLMPWGAMSLAQLMEYPYWNARYHEGQINFIASLLGCLQ